MLKTSNGHILFQPWPIYHQPACDPAASRDAANHRGLLRPSLCSQRKVQRLTLLQLPSKEEGMI